MTDEKIERIKMIKPVQLLKDVQQFLGFTNFYRCFIKNYTKIMLLMTNSTSLRKQDWQSTTMIEQAQQNLLTTFTMVPILRHFDLEEIVIVETNASDFTLAGPQMQ